MASEPIFSVLVFTAPPPEQAVEAAGAFVKVDGRESLLRSVELFLNRDNVKQIQLCFLEDMLEEGKRKFGGHLSFSGVKVIGGGPLWLDQAAAAVPKLSEEATHVIVHDAARPAVPYSDIDNLMDAARTHAAVALASPVRSTLVETDEHGAARRYHLPRTFMHLLTPQAYTREMFLKLAESKKEVPPSDLTLVKGSPLNLRVGGSGDAGLVGTMLRMLPKPKIKPPSSPFEEAQW